MNTESQIWNELYDFSGYLNQRIGDASYLARISKTNRDRMIYENEERVLKEVNDKLRKQFNIFSVDTSE